MISDSAPRLLPASTSAIVSGVAMSILCAATALAQVPTRLSDFFLPGTQPETISDPIASSDVCKLCHGDFDTVTEPLRPWQASLMGQAARDPLFRAALVVANQDADFAGDLCLRCHTPSGWLEGRSTPTDGSALIAKDFEGVTCNACHRIVDPVPRDDYEPNDPLAVDRDILDMLDDLPAEPHSGDYVIDPQDRRRGPYDLLDFGLHFWIQAPYARQAALCGTCHDVSNPVYTQQPDGTYAFNDPNTPHPTQSKYDQFPIERTFSEWAASAFAQGPIDMGGRFGGNQPTVSTCQDCHMPATAGRGSPLGEFRDDLPTHYFNGGNTWILPAVRNLYRDSDTGLSAESVADSLVRAEEMLLLASDLELELAGGDLLVRVINQTGHKLPTGYPEGRRMWVNVRFYDGEGVLIDERGAYDTETATLTPDTAVYEAVIGIDAAVAALTGLPEGPGFHFALNNVWHKDNRIPPRGFTSAGFAAVQCAPVGAGYPDGAFWAEQRFTPPRDAASAEVRVYYQTTSREYVEFLRDENTTDDAGQIAYDQWLATGQSAPVEIDFADIALPAGDCAGDVNGDGVVGLDDLAILIANFDTPSGATRGDGDLDGDGDVDLTDLALLLRHFEEPC